MLFFCQYVSYLDSVIKNDYFYLYVKYYYNFINNGTKFLRLILIYLISITYIIYDLHSKEESYYINLLQNDIDTIQRDYLSAIGIILGNLFKIIFSIIALIFVSYKIFIFFMIFTFIPPIVIKYVKPYISKIMGKYSEQSVIYLRKIKEFIQGIDTIITFSRGNIFRKKLQDEDFALEKIRLERDFWDNSINCLSTSLGMISHIACMITAAYFIATEHLEIGALITSTQLLNFVFTPFNNMISRITILKSVKHIENKFSGLINTPEENRIYDFKNGNIEINNLVVKLDNKIIINNFNAILEKGKCYAIIGKSGAGKTTLIKTLLQYYNDYSGEIKIGGIDIRSIKRDSLYSNIIYIPQNPFMFMGTVEENISLYRDNIDVKEVTAKVSLDANMLNQHIGDSGNQISGGEKQRISLARALLEKPYIMIFDEPTSAQDPITSQIIDNIIQSIDNITKIVITHNWNEDYLAKFDGVIEL